MTTNQVENFEFYNPMVQIRFQSSDFATATSSSTSSLTASQKPGLSVAAEAGIAIGVAIGAVLFIGAAVMFWRRRSRRSPPKDTHSKEQPTPMYPNHELATQKQYSHQEMDAIPKYPQEMHAVDASTELAANSMAHTASGRLLI